MKLKTAKVESDITLQGCSAQLVKDEHGNTIRVCLKDTSGNYLEVMNSRYTGLDVMVPAPPELKEKWRLSGKFLKQMPIQEDFDLECEAKKRGDELAETASTTLEDCGLTVEKVKIEVK